MEAIESYEALQKAVTEKLGSAGYRLLSHVAEPAAPGLERARLLVEKGDQRYMVAARYCFTGRSITSVGVGAIGKTDRKRLSRRHRRRLKFGMFEEGPNDIQPIYSRATEALGKAVNTAYIEIISQRGVYFPATDLGVLKKAFGRVLARWAFKIPPKGSAVPVSI